MPKQQVLHRTVSGLQLEPNPFQAPEGALIKADNCNIDRDGVICKRRGMDYYHSTAPGLPAGYFVGEYLDKLHVYDSSNELVVYDTGSSWGNDPTATKGPPDALTRIRGVEIRSNFYYTTENSLYKEDTVSPSSFSQSKVGMPQGLDIALTLTSTNIAASNGADWFLGDSRVGYRVVFSRTDANDFKIDGAPSFREEIANIASSVLLDYSGGVVTVNHSAHGFSTGDTVTISSSAVPLYEGSHTITVLDDDYYYYIFSLAVPKNDDGTFAVDVTDVVATAGRTGIVNLVTTIPDDVVAGDIIEVYRTKMSASASTPTGDRLFRIWSTEVTAADISAGTVTLEDIFNEAYLGVELYTNPTQQTILKANDRPPWTKDIALFKGHTFLINTRQEHQLEFQILELDSFIAGTSSLTIAGLTYTAETAEDISNGEFLLSTARSTVAENIEKTAESLVRVINRISGNTTVYAFYVSETDDAPGKILIRGRDVEVSSFTLDSATSEIHDSIDPQIVVTAPTPQTSTDGARPNGLQRSKFEQPEAFPESNFDSVGSEEIPGLRILKLRDSLIIFKEEGVWRLSGDTESDFVISQIDPSVRLIAPESAIIVNNNVYAFTNQGVVRVNENGITIMSKDVESELMKIQQFTNFETITHATSYEAEHKYLLWTQNVTGDTIAEVAWVYDWLSGVWTKWLKSCNSAYVLRGEDLLYIVHGNFAFVMKERKDDNDTTDYNDEEITSTQSTITITDAAGTTTNIFGDTVSDITLSYSSQDEPLAAGFLLNQGGETERIITVVDNGGNSYTVELESLNSSYTNATATLTVGIPAEIEWVPEDAQNPFVQKQFPEVSIYMERDITKFHELGFKSDVVPSQTFSRRVVDITTESAITPVRMIVPRAYQRCRTLSLSYRNIYARETFELVGASLVFRPMSERSTLAPR